MYELVLTRPERDSIDVIGPRYGHGDCLRKILSKCLGENQCWYDDGAIEFFVPEHLAWAIMDEAQACDYRWDCLPEALASKLTDFCSVIV